jgi:ribonuclease BN (tRNA processing enzyme)
MMRMRLTVIGSADAFNSGGRGHSCYLLESAGAGALMVDFGPTALMGLRHASFEPNRLDGIVFTHMHGDHIGGFPFILIDALYNGVRRRELPILGPARTRECLEALLDATYDEMKDRMSLVPISIDELTPGQTRDFVGYRIEAFAAEHMDPPHRPLCLRITDPQGTVVAFSGDTLPCPGLFAAAQGASLLVAECTRLAQPAGHHCTWEDWKQQIPTLGAKSLMLTHLGADVRARVPDLEAQMRDARIPVRFAEDGLVIDL